MTIRSKAFLKDEFEAGTTVTSTMMGDLIDSTMRDIPIAIASAAEGGKTGILAVTSATGVTAHPAGTVGLQLLTAETTAAASAMLSERPQARAYTGDWVLLATTTIETTASSVVIDNNIRGLEDFDIFVILLNGIRGALSSPSGPTIRFSFNSGATYYSNALGYVFGATSIVFGSAAYDRDAANSTLWRVLPNPLPNELDLSPLVTNSMIRLIRGGGPGGSWSAYHSSVCISVSGTSGIVSDGSMFLSTAANPNAIRVVMDPTDFFPQGTISIYGVSD